MLWLPAAERYRRGLLATFGLGLLTYQALWPVPFVESMASLALAPPSRLLAGLCGRIVGVPLEAASPPAPAAPELAEVERRLGEPPQLQGVVWLEVPVAQARSYRLELDAGRRAGLAEDLPVVFGDHWLGRLSEVEEDRAEVLLWTAPGARTGGSIGAPPAALDAVFLGRGQSGAPILDFLGAEEDPQRGAPVHWRRRAEDPPALGTLRLSLGELQQVGDPARGEDVWVSGREHPAGALGRVFVAVGALPGEPIQETEVKRAPASPVLPACGVWGAALAAARSDARFPAAVLLRDDLVVGKVVARRGRLLWTLRRAPDRWQGESLAVEPRLGELRDAPAGRAGTGAELEPGSRYWLFTRARGTLPRGLLLGRSGDPPPPWWPGALEVAGR